MYHHFKGKPDLALAAIRRLPRYWPPPRAYWVRPVRPTSASRRICAGSETVLRGCPVGRLTMDPDVIASAELRAPSTRRSTGCAGRLAGIVEEGKEQGQFAQSLDAEEIAATILATVQGGDALARASGSPAAFDTAVRGLLARSPPPVGASAEDRKA